MGILGRAKVRLSLALRGLLRRPVRLGFPLDGLRGYFPGAFARRPPEVHYVLQMVERIRSHFVCFDVGAYIGYYTLLFAKYAREAHAFEPLPANLAVLRENVRLNGLENVSIHPVAVAEREGAVRIGASLGSDSMASARRADAPTRLDVPTTSLDAFCAASGASPDLVKIDVEGLELEVLRGMRGVLDEKRPIVFLEIHTTQLTDEEAGEVFAILGGAGYRMHSWLEDVDPGGYGFWRHMTEVGCAADLRVGATLAIPGDRPRRP